MTSTMMVNGYVLDVSDEGRVWRDNGVEAARNDNGLGYLRVHLGKKAFMVHRVVWTAFRGPIPAGMQVDHIDHDKTNNRLDNLQLLSPSQNTQRFHDIARANGGINKRSFKRLGDDAAIAIREAYAAGTPRIELARQYGVTRGCIRHIVNNRYYKNIICNSTK